MARVVVTRVVWGAAMLGVVACGSGGGGTATIATTTVPVTTSAATTATVPVSTSATTTTTTLADVESTVTTATSDILLLEVPRRVPPTIDGTIESTEWDGAAVTQMDDGTELLWLHADGSLYLGVRHDTMGAVNLVVSDGDRIRVLHSSAALGSAEYARQGDGTWRLEHDFDWCCRVVSDSESVALLFAEEGWRASIGYAGEPGDVEFQMVMDAGGLRVAVSMVDANARAAFWPVGLLPAERDPLYGELQDREAFAPQAWARLVAVG